MLMVMIKQVSTCLDLARASKTTVFNSIPHRARLISTAVLRLPQHRPRPPSRHKRGCSASNPVNGHGQTLNGNTPAVDAVLILAGGFKEDGSLPAWVTRRLDLAHDICRHQDSNVPIVCLGGGTPHKPPILDPRGHVVHEATMCANYLLDKGAPASSLLKEISSYDTVGNAYFSLTIHAIPAGWRRLAVVTSAFHMPRTQQLFEDMYSIASNSIYGCEDRFDLSYFSASDEGLFDEATYQARVSKEAQSLESWVKTRKSITDMQGLHAWLHDSHLCYAVARQEEFGFPTISDPKLLASY